MADGRRWQVVRDELRHEAWRAGSAAGRAAPAGRRARSGWVRRATGRRCRATAGSWWGQAGTRRSQTCGRGGADAPGAGVLRSPVAAYRVSW